MSQELASLETELVQFIRDTLQRPDGELVRSMPLNAAGLDSLSLIETVFCIEEKYGITIPFNANARGGQAGRFQTVGDVLDVVLGLIAAKSAVPAL